MAQTPPEGPMSHMDNPPSTETPEQRERLQRERSWQTITRFLDIFGAANPFKRFSEDYINANSEHVRDDADKKCDPSWGLDKYFQVIGDIYNAKHTDRNYQNDSAMLYRDASREVLDFARTRYPDQREVEDRIQQFLDTL